MSKRYILDGKTPKECPNLFKWALWVQTENMCVAATKKEDVRVSTVFLGLDYQHGAGPPLLFETAVIGGQRAGDQARYSTWEQAEAGHVVMCVKVFGEGGKHGSD